MNITLSHPTKSIKGKIQLTSSKSESNRALIIQALCNDDFLIHNLSDSTDTQTLKRLLYSGLQEMNVNDAGTTMRFLTAYLSLQKGHRILTGSERMKERPIKILVDALRKLDANIECLEKEGFPPIKIIGKELLGGQINVDGSVSSQYISALLMVAPKLKNGLVIHFSGTIISKPYINMTIKMMQYFGIEVFWDQDSNSIIIKEGKFFAKDYEVEADWSAASYWYSMVAMAKEADITLYGLKENSLQGDAEVRIIYENFGVKTTFVDGGVHLTKTSDSKFQTSNIEINFTNFPDLAQSVAVTCAGLNINAKLTGLGSLRIKETNRIDALQTELNKLGFNVATDEIDLLIDPVSSAIKWKGKQVVNTYNDHRMAMAFAPLAFINEISINDPEVVKKSYPKFWEDLGKVGIEFN